MVTPNQRRRVVGMLMERFGVSQRRACRVVGQARSTQRLAPRLPDDEKPRSGLGCATLRNVDRGGDGVAPG
jgi:hypothetical protein